MILWAPLTFWAILLFIGNGALLCMMAYRIFKHSQLEEDYLNPVDYAKSVDRLFPIEMCVHAGLVAMIFWFHFSFWLLLLNLPLLAYNIKSLVDNSFRTDPAKVWTTEFKMATKRETVGKLAFLMLCFFCYLYNVVLQIIHISKQKTGGVLK